MSILSKIAGTVVAGPVKNVTKAASSGLATATLQKKSAPAPTAGGLVGKAMKQMQGRPAPAPTAGGSFVGKAVGQMKGRPAPAKPAAPVAKPKPHVSEVMEKLRGNQGLATFKRR